MDISPYLGTIVTVVIAVGGVYAAIAQRLTKLETMIENLASITSKHNNVIERTYRLETEMTTAFKHIDTLRDTDNRIMEKLDKIKGEENGRD